MSEAKKGAKYRLCVNKYLRSVDGILEWEKKGRARNNKRLTPKLSLVWLWDHSSKKKEREREREKERLTVRCLCVITFEWSVIYLLFSLNNVCSVSEFQSPMWQKLPYVTFLLSHWVWENVFSGIRPAWNGKITAATVETLSSAWPTFCETASKRASEYDVVRLHAV
jgi:hypothetical protein